MLNIQVVPSRTTMDVWHDKNLNLRALINFTSDMPNVLF